MHKLKAFFKSIVDTGNSETYAFWGSAITSVICHASATACTAINGFSESFLGVPSNVAIAGLFGYTVLRMTSKGAKAQTPAVKP